VADTLLAGGKPPESVTLLGPAHLATARHVAQDSPALWELPIYHRGFDGAHISATRTFVDLDPETCHPPKSAPALSGIHRPVKGKVRGLFVGGEWIVRSPAIEVSNPLYGCLAGTVSSGGPADVDAAVTKAAKALAANFPAHAAQAEREAGRLVI
jgi:hypothetical protein